MREQARDLAAQLTANYDVERTDGVEQGSTTIALNPTGGGAPITFTLTDFPGVIVTYGHAGEAIYPWCGCDACDEDPDELSEEMDDLVADIVAGGLVEERKRRVLRSDLYQSRLEHRGGGSRRCSRDVEDDLADRMPEGQTDWPPWPRRGQGA